MKRLTAGILLVLALLAGACSARADKATSYTYTLNEKGRHVRTQDAYLPDKTITTLGLAKPSDLFFASDGHLYIADSGNKRVIIYDPENNEVNGEIRHQEFSAPTGIFVTDAGKLYVADPAARKVFLFDGEGALIRAYKKLDSPAFSDIRYEPMKVASDAAGNLYIVGEGVYHGVIQLAGSGEFLGYFTVNRTRLTLTQAIQRLLFNREQLSKLVETVPTTFSNVFVDRAGIVYTTTMSTGYNPVKKHRTDGGNMFTSPVIGPEALSDVWVDAQGLIYTCDQTGYLQVYSALGELIFYFGSSVVNLDVAGLYSRLPALAVDHKGQIWTLDMDKGYLQSFMPTDYARTVYSALGLYEKGRYQESLQAWQEVLRLNQMSVLAHNGIAKAYFHHEDYEKAMEHFRVAGNRPFYSEAFWEVRNAHIQKWLPWVAAGLAALAAARRGFGRLRRKRGAKPPGAGIAARLRKVPLVSDLSLALEAPRHPVDRFYEVRRKRRGSVLGASILYAVYFFIFMVFQTRKGFIYQFVQVEDMDIKALVAGYFLLIGLFILCNYLVTSINDGDGDLAQCYMIPAYSLAPLMLAFSMVVLLSHALTYGESFLLSVILLSGAVWTLVTLFLALMHVHDYTVKETVRCLALTVIFIMIFFIMALIVMVMGEKLTEFLRTVFEEVMRNVYGS